MMTVLTIMTMMIRMTMIVISVFLNLMACVTMCCIMIFMSLMAVGEYCVYHGAVNADVSSSSENMTLEVLGVNVSPDPVWFGGVVGGD